MRKFRKAIRTILLNFNILNLIYKMEKDKYLERIIAYKYVILKRIGEGTFGSIYYGDFK